MEVLYLCIPLVLLALYIITQHFLGKLQNLPPSPFPTLPLVGHLYLLKKPFHRSLAEISYKHGPVLLLWFGSRPVLVVTSPSAAEECFSKNDIAFANRPPLLSAKYFGYNYTSLVWAAYGDHWRNLRRITSLEVLSSHRLQMLSHIRLEEVRALIRQLFQVSTGSPNRMVEMKSALFKLTFNVMTRMILGKKYYGEKLGNSEEAKMFQEIITEAARVIPESQVLDFLPFMRWFGFGRTEEKLFAIQEKRDRFMQNIIEEYSGMEAKSSFGAGGRKKNIIEVLLSLRETEPEYYTDEAIRNLMLVLLQAGSDTTASTMEWAFSLLLDNPEVLKKAQAEIDNCVGQDRLVEETDLAELPYLCGIINETLRVHPPAPLLMPRKSSEECMVGGFHIPRGTMLLANAWAIQHDRKIWVDPEKFKPERFGGLEGGDRDGFKLMPFGSGRRGCPGESLALRILGLALGSLIQCFDWEKSVNEETIDMTEATGFMASKVQPLMAKCYTRPNIVKLLSQM